MMSEIHKLGPRASACPTIPARFGTRWHAVLAIVSTRGEKRPKQPRSRNIAGTSADMHGRGHATMNGIACSFTGQVNSAP